MAAEYKPAEGFLGNLNKEQESKLRDLWRTVFKLYDLYETKDPELMAAIKAAGEKTDTASKSRFGLFGGGTSQSKADATNVVEKYLNLASADDATNMANRKRFMEMLAIYDTKTLKAMIVEAVKADHPDALVLRFLRARKWNVDAALIMMVFAMDWRYHEAKLDSDIMFNGDAKMVKYEKSTDKDKNTMGVDFMKQLRGGKGYLHGVDKMGRPISCVRVKKHKPFDQSNESLERFIVYLIETGRFTLQPPVETCCLIFDLSGFTLANMDYVPLKFIIKCFEANYPESLGVVLVHNAPWVFKSIWGAIKGLLDPVVAAKVNFTYGREGLEEFIDPSQIIKELGGDEDWEFEYTEPVKGENKRLKDTAAKDAIQKERDELADQFEAISRKWIDTPDGPEADEMKKERDRLAILARENYWKLDPYVRARSMYDRQGIIQEGGKVDWYKKAA